MNVRKFDRDFKRYKKQLESKFDTKTVRLMLRSFCIGYCQILGDLRLEFKIDANIDPILDKINEINETLDSEIPK